MDPTQLTAILDDIGRRIGPAGQHVYELAVRQAVITGVIELVGGLLLLISAVVIAVVVPLHFKSARRAYEARTLSGGYRYDSGPDRDIYVVVGVVGVAATLIFGAGCVASSVTHLLNPEYVALRDILSTLGVK